MKTKSNWERRNRLVPFIVGIILISLGARTQNIPMTILGVVMTWIAGYYLKKEADEEDEGDQS